MGLGLVCLGFSGELGEPDNNLWRSLHHHVKNEIIDQFDFSKVRRVCVDETAIKRGHYYVSIFVDYDTGNVLYIADGRKKEVFEQFSWLALRQWRSSQKHRAV